MRHFPAHPTPTPDRLLQLSLAIVGVCLLLPALPSRAFAQTAPVLPDPFAPPVLLPQPNLDLERQLYLQQQEFQQQLQQQQWRQQESLRYQQQQQQWQNQQQIWQQQRSQQQQQMWQNQQQMWQQQQQRQWQLENGV